jgi:hypothetical protein
VGDQAGAIVSGDFNGDGIMDIIGGASSANGPKSDRASTGEAYLFLGPFASGCSLDAASGDYDSVFYGAKASDGLARTLALGRLQRGRRRRSRLFPVSNFRNMSKQFLMDNWGFALAP